MEAVQKIANPLNLTTGGNIGFWFAVVGVVFTLASLTTQFTIINNGAAGSMVSEIMSEDTLAIGLTSVALLFLGGILYSFFETSNDKYLMVFLLAMSSFAASILSLLYAQYSVTLK